jgi:hypothetical protein
VSNLQVITAVNLNPLKTKNRTYQLPAADKKTIATGMVKVLRNMGVVQS